MNNLFCLDKVMYVTFKRLIVHAYICADTSRFWKNTISYLQTRKCWITVNMYIQYSSTAVNCAYISHDFISYSSASSFFIDKKEVSFHVRDEKSTLFCLFTTTLFYQRIRYSEKVLKDQRWNKWRWFVDTSNVLDKVFGTQFQQYPTQVYIYIDVVRQVLLTWL